MTRIDPRGLVAPALVAVLVVATASVSGGYFPSAWGWGTAALALAAAGVLVLTDELDASALDVAFVAALAGFVAWTGASVLWSASVPRSVLEVQRGVLYVTATGAFLLAARGRTPRALASGALAGALAVALWALAPRALPELVTPPAGAPAQLAIPPGYWNALALVAALGVLLALGEAGAERGRVRPLAAATLPALATTLYLTFSRGGWFALGFGLVVLVALAPDRQRAAATDACGAAASAPAVWAADPAHGRSPHLLAVVVAAAALVAAAIPRAADGVVRRVPRIAAPRKLVALGAAVALAAAVAAFAAFGGRAYDSFKSSSTPAAGADLNARLFSVGGNARADYWRVAWDDARAHPLLGSGAGTFELRWERDRPTDFGAHDAHNLYLETLAELGPAGLALLLAALAVPFARVRRSAAAPAAAYAAFLAHAGVDWDWETPTVTLLALACACALVVAARPERVRRRVPASTRVLALGAAGALAVAGVAGYAATTALNRSLGAYGTARYADAEAHARRAHRLEPWAAEPWLALGEAQLARGDRGAAVDSFLNATAADPNDWLPWFRLSVASQGSVSAEALARARRLNPRAAELGSR